MHYQRQRHGVPLNACTVPGCDRPAHAKGLCRAHYDRRRDGASLDAPVRAYRQPKATCTVEGCPRGAVARGLCGAHYQRALKGRPVDSPIRSRVDAPSVGCSVPGCDRRVKSRGLCPKHYERQRTGRPLDAPIKRGRPRREVVVPERALPVEAEPKDRRTCLNCGQPFPPAEWNLKLFCSNKCACAYRHATGGPVVLGEREFTCAGCGQRVRTAPTEDFRWRFCSRSCREKWRQSYRNKRVGQHFGGDWKIEADAAANAAMMREVEDLAKRGWKP